MNEKRWDVACVSKTLCDTDKTKESLKFSLGLNATKFSLEIGCVDMA
jgi:hypothetical protein